MQRQCHESIEFALAQTVGTGARNRVNRRDLRVRYGEFQMSLESCGSDDLSQTNERAL